MRIARRQMILWTAIGWGIGLALVSAMLVDFSQTNSDFGIAIVAETFVSAAGGLIAGVMLGIGLFIALPKMPVYKIVLLGLIWAVAFGGFQYIYGTTGRNEFIPLTPLILPPIIGAVGGLLSSWMVLSSWQVSLSGLFTTALGWGLTLLFFPWLSALLGLMLPNHSLNSTDALAFALVGGIAGSIASLIGSTMMIGTLEAALANHHFNRKMGLREDDAPQSVGDLLATPGSSGYRAVIVEDDGEEKPKRKPKPHLPLLQVSLFAKAIVVAVIVVGIIWWVAVPVRFIPVYITPTWTSVAPAQVQNYDNWDWGLPLLTKMQLGIILPNTPVWITRMYSDPNLGHRYSIKTLDGRTAEAYEGQLAIPEQPIDLSSYATAVPPMTDTSTPTSTPTLGATP